MTDFSIINSDKLASGLKNIFRSLKYRNYRLYFGGQSVSLIGTWIQQIAMPWLVYRMTGSTFLLGLVGFTSMLPTFVVTPFAGVLTDRWNKRKSLIITQILAMLQALILSILYLTGALKVFHIILLGIFLGCVNAFDMPLRQAFLIELIDKKEDLLNAIALNSSMVNAARLVGPSVAGVLIGATGNEGICFLINAVSYIFVIFSLFGIKIPSVRTASDMLSPAGDKEKISFYKRYRQEAELFWHEFKSGITYVYGVTALKRIILLLGVVSLMGMPYAVLMPVFATKILKGGPHTFGFLMGASGVGALVAGFYLASRRGITGLEKFLPVSVGIFGLGLISFSFSRIFVLSMILMLVTGFGMLSGMASSNTIIQTITDDDKRGRVMSFYTMAFMGTAPFGSLIAGAVASAIGAPDTLRLGGIICILSAAIFERSFRHISI